ncbi:MAG: hypothetical protein JNJ73_17515 [Hyphomonadaceae bacterium]|nr:hypothetical protein [Hyphomonadaceae bacterium]
MSDTLPPDVRPRAVAAVELILDVTYVATSLVGSDLETMLIYFCVAEATMRPLMSSREANPEAFHMTRPPEELRGSISRLAIADRTGLPRETVRRKVNALIKAGMLSKDEDKRVRATPTLGEPRVQTSVNDVFQAVQRYRARLRELGVSDEPAPTKSGEKT